MAQPRVGVGRDTLLCWRVPAPGLVTVEVTNDGVRWSSGLDVDTERVAWPLNSTVAPLDYSAALAPSEMTLGTLYASPPAHVLCRRGL